MGQSLMGGFPLNSLCLLEDCVVRLFNSPAPVALTLTTSVSNRQPHKKAGDFHCLLKVFSSIEAVQVLCSSRLPVSHTRPLLSSVDALEAWTFSFCVSKRAFRSVIHHFQLTLFLFTSQLPSWFPQF